MSSTGKIRKILLDEIDSLISGKSDGKRARAVTKAAAQVIYATRIEIENKRIEVDISKTLSDKPRWDKIDGDSVSIPTLDMGE